MDHVNSKAVLILVEHGGSGLAVAEFDAVFAQSGGLVAATSEWPLQAALVGVLTVISCGRELATRVEVGRQFFLWVDSFEVELLLLLLGHMRDLVQILNVDWRVINIDSVLEILLFRLSDAHK